MEKKMERQAPVDPNLSCPNCGRKLTQSALTGNMICLKCMSLPKEHIEVHSALKRFCAYHHTYDIIQLMADLNKTGSMYQTNDDVIDALEDASRICQHWVENYDPTP